MRTPCTKKDAPAEQHGGWDLAKEREFAVDSGASMDMMSKKELLSSEELDTVVPTSNGEVHTKEEAQANVHDLNLFCCCVAWKTLRRPRIFLRVGQRSKTTADERREDNCAKRTTSYLLLFPGCPPVLGAIRRQHRHRRICLPQVQLMREVTNQLHESGAGSPSKTQNKSKEGWQSRFGRPFARSSWMVGGVHR